jgi:ribosomal RNA-processing protein 12
MTDREQELVDDDYDTETKTTPTIDGGCGRSCDDYDEAMSKFASQCLAFLLQYRPNGANSHVGGVNGDDVNTVYGRCLMACMGRMLGKTLSDNTDDGSGGGGGGGGGSDDDNNTKDAPASKLLAIKLIPNVLTSMLNICEVTSSGGSSDDQYDSCGAAFNQFVSNTIPVVVSYLKKKERTNDKIHRMSLEMLALCIPIVQRALQIQYRSAWGSILSGGYATFTLTLARHLLLEQRGFVSGSSDGIVETSDLYCQLSTWVQTLVLSLLRLHDDVVKGGGPARTAVEYATSTIIRGMGIELFLSTVDFVNEDDYGDGAGDARKKTLSSSSTTGGGIRDDRAWLLPLMKQSTSSTFSKSTWLVGDDDITSRTHLSFFQGNVLSLARKCDAASADGHRTVAEASIQKARVVELWSLFPLFCVHPLDMKESFGSVAKTVVKALGDHERYPKLIVSTMTLFNLCI